MQYHPRQRVINTRTNPARFNPTYEFDIYGTNGQLTIIGKTKVRTDPAVINSAVERIKEAARKHPGNAVITVYCLRTLQGAWRGLGN